MADIAFLLLIFSLLSTTISADKGILRTLPGDCPPNADCSKSVEAQNLMIIRLNAQSELMLNSNKININKMKTALINFIDNNGLNQCDYCSGSQDPLQSDHPTKSFIGIEIHRDVPYKTYIQVQDIITNTYYDLRQNYATKTYKKTVDQLNKQELMQLKKVYPFNLLDIRTGYDAIE
jgi:biopolymer transport protein ExbD